MRMRFWSVLAVLSLGLLILGSQAFAASQTLKLQQAAERRAARQVLAGELERLGAVAERLRPDSVVRPRVVEGMALRVEVVTGARRDGVVPVRVRVMDAGGTALQEHRTVLAVAVVGQEAGT